MKNEKNNERKGFFGRLTENKKSKKGSCCCNIELEEITEDKDEKNKGHEASNKENN